MKKILCTIFLLISIFGLAQTKRLVALGSSTTAGLSASPLENSWVRKISQLYKTQLGIADTVYNLGVSATTVYQAMPGSYTPPAGRPLPNPNNNVTRALSLLSNLPVPADGVIIVNFPSNGYDNYTIPEIMNALQIIYDSAVRFGNKCYITTTQPRTSGTFAPAAVRRKLGVIKDSIVNRFGVARTLNFWDDIINPLDSTIATVYSAGDNIHLNNAGHQLLFERVRAKNIFDQPVLSYRSNVSNTGLWSNPANWQIFNGTSWVAATVPPSAQTASSIRILNGDSIRINNFHELDEVIIEPGGILSIFNTTAAPPGRATVSVNNGAGNDITVQNNGRLYIAANGILNGDGNIVIDDGGFLYMRNRGVLELNVINNGTFGVRQTGIVRNRTIINNRLFVLDDLTLNLIRSTFINNDTFRIAGVGTTFIADSTLAGSIFANESTGVLIREASTGITNFNASIAFSNSGQVAGLGEYAFYNPSATSSGQLNPGRPIGSLVVNPAFFNNRTPAIQIQIGSTGAVQGVNYDHIQVSNIAPTAKNISGATLSVTDSAADPVGTVYTILTAASGSFTGNFSSVNLSPTLSGPFINAGTISVVKFSMLPLRWGSFSASQEDHRVRLRWSSLQETNTAHFVIQHSANGRDFIDIDSLQAAGNSSVPVEYSFLHHDPKAGNNFYRLKQVDLDAAFSYSNTVNIVLKEGFSLPVQSWPNPVKDLLTLKIDKAGLIIHITDMQGRVLRRARYAVGTHQMDIRELRSGFYQLSIFNESGYIGGWRIVKQ